MKIESFSPRVQYDNERNICITVKRVSLIAFGLAIQGSVAQPRSTLKSRRRYYQKPEKYETLSSFHSNNVCRHIASLYLHCHLLSIPWNFVVRSVSALYSTSAVCLGLETGTRCYLYREINNSRQPLQPSRNRHDSTMEAL